MALYFTYGHVHKSEKLTVFPDIMDLRTRQININPNMMKTPKILASAYSFIFKDKRMSPLWLIARLYLGWQWLQAGYEKAINPAWIGPDAGAALSGFIKGALAKTAGAHPDVSSGYAWFLENLVLPHAHAWSHVIAYGEVFVGLGLIFGLLTYLAALFGFFMNMNYLLAGTVSTNPMLLAIALLIMMAGKIAGYIGLDYFWKRKNQ